MNRKRLLTCFFLSAALFACRLDAGQEDEHYPENLKYLKFDGFREDITGPSGSDYVVGLEDDSSVPSQEWRKDQMRLWRSAIEEAVMILPPSFMEKLGNVNFIFFINQSIWVSGYVDKVFFPNTVYINLLPSTKGPIWMFWETVPQNGFAREEMVFLALHEMAHVFSGGKEFDGFYGSGVPILEEAPTYYGRKWGIKEDWAESFAIYVMYPEYLKKGRYEVIRGVLGKEYNGNYPLNPSLVSYPEEKLQ